MEKVYVKLVVFKQKTMHEEGEYCGYCPALGAFHVMTSLRNYLLICKTDLKETLQDVFITVILKIEVGKLVKIRQNHLPLQMRNW